MMGIILRTLVACGAVLLASLITATSCGKSPGVKTVFVTNTITNTDRNSAGNSGKDADEMTVYMDTNLSKFEGTSEIVLKASQFPRTAVGPVSTHFGRVVDPSTPATAIKPAFSFELKDATGGLLFLFQGNANYPETQRPTTFANTAADNTGVKMVQGETTASGGIPAGLNFFSVFASKHTPTTNDPNSEPFAFTTSTGASGTQPILWCVTTIPGIANINSDDFATKTLEGGQITDCYIASLGNSIANPTALSDWFRVTRRSPPFKRSVAVKIFAIRTDTKTIANIGLPGINDAAKVAAFRNGLSYTDILFLHGNNPTFYSKVLHIRIVGDSDFGL